jgi:hypothetical protein
MPAKALLAVALGLAACGLLLAAATSPDRAKDKAAPAKAKKGTAAAEEAAAKSSDAPPHPLPLSRRERGAEKPKPAPAAFRPEPRWVEDEPPAGAILFRPDVMPLLSRAGCNQVDCHGGFRGKGGLKLSLFGADAESDFEAITRSGKGREINSIEPRQSLLLLKATAAVQHGGQRRLEPGSKDYALLLAWIAQNTRWDDARRPKLVSLRIEPKEQIIAGGQSGRLTATAVFSDGSEQDVTGQAVLRPLDPKVIGLGPGGSIQALAPGEATILATYMRQPDVCRVIVPRDLPGGFPEVQPLGKIDELVLAKLKKLGLPPAQLSSDEVFLRRVYLDVIGVLPTADEARTFLADKDAEKRRKLIDRLLVRDEFADFWALKWGDLLKIKSEYPSRLWPKAVETYYPWLRESIARNEPYDQFVRDLLVATGSNFRSGPANYFRAVPNKDPQTLAEATALVFLGVRIGCARCHGHPTENWSLDDDLGLAAFFAQVAYKPTSEWKEEIVYLNPKGVLRHPKTKLPVRPKCLGAAAAEIAPEEDPRAALARWLTAPENPWFAKNIVNRIWFWLLGRGIVHEPDDLRPTNPPENPELLACLEQELVSHHYDLRHIYRLILNSRTYQLSSHAEAAAAEDTVHFARYYPKRLGAEQLLDAIVAVTGVPDRFSSRIPEPFTNLPPGHRAEQLSDGNIEEAPFAFLELFGRPPRDTSYEEERCSVPSLRQALYFVNSEHLEAKIATSERLKQLAAAGKGDAAVIEEIYLAMLSRLPREAERRAAAAYLAQNKAARPQAVRDLVWAVFNTKEFLFNH